MDMRYHFDNLLKNVIENIESTHMGPTGCLGSIGVTGCVGTPGLTGYFGSIWSVGSSINEDDFASWKPSWFSKFKMGGKIGNAILIIFDLLQIVHKNNGIVFGGIVQNILIKSDTLKCLNIWFKSFEDEQSFFKESKSAYMKEIMIKTFVSSEFPSTYTSIDQMTYSYIDGIKSHCEFSKELSLKLIENKRVIVYPSFMNVDNKDIWDTRNMRMIELLIEGWKLFLPIRYHPEFLYDERLPKDIRLNIINLYFLLIDSWTISDTKY